MIELRYGAPTEESRRIAKPSYKSRKKKRERKRRGFRNMSFADACKGRRYLLPRGNGCVLPTEANRSCEERVTTIIRASKESLASITSSTNITTERRYSISRYSLRF